MRTIWGVDYASVDGNAPPDWRAFAKAGGSFAWLRASFGYLSKARKWVIVDDPVFTRDWAGIPASLVRGAYMFPIPQAPQSPEEQVAIFASAVRAGGIDRGRDFPACLDVEFPSGIAGTGLTRAQLVEWIRRAVVALTAEFGIPPIIYTSGRVWNDVDADCLGDPPGPSELLACDLWLARYAYKTRVPAVLPPPESSDPPAPHPWGDEWHAHQDQGDAIGVPGFTSTVDVDRWRHGQRGDRGGHVLRVQRRLGIVADGAWGPKTQAALDAFQSAHGLQSGVLDPRTYAVMAWNTSTK